MNNPKRICSYTELKSCFPKYRELFLEFQSKDANGITKETEQCFCLQNCLDSNVIVEKFQVLKGTKALLGSIGGLVIMKKYPLIRFQREVIFTLTDFFGTNSKSFLKKLKFHQLLYLQYLLAALQDFL